MLISEQDVAAQAKKSPILEEKSSKTEKTFFRKC